MFSLKNYSIALFNSNNNFILQNCLNPTSVSFYGPSLWNKLPGSLQTCSSFYTFNKQLKLYLQKCIWTIFIIFLSWHLACTMYTLILYYFTTWLMTLSWLLLLCRIIIVILALTNRIASLDVNIRFCVLFYINAIR